MYVYDHATKKDVFDLHLDIIEKLVESNIDRGELLVILGKIREILNIVKMCEIVDCVPNADSRIKVSRSTTSGDPS